MDNERMMQLCTFGQLDLKVYLTATHTQRTKER